MGIFTFILKTKGGVNELKSRSAFSSIPRRRYTNDEDNIVNTGK